MQFDGRRTGALHEDEENTDITKGPKKEESNECLAF